MASSFLRLLDHTQRRTTVGRTPLDEWSARRGDLCLTRNTHNRQISMPPVGFAPHDLSRRAAADLRLRPRGYWDRLSIRIVFLNRHAHMFLRILHAHTLYAVGYSQHWRCCTEFADGRSRDCSASCGWPKSNPLYSFANSAAPFLPHMSKIFLAANRYDGGLTLRRLMSYI